jgi:hypothetical protein
MNAPDTALRDALFRYLVKFAVVENYLKRVVPGEYRTEDGQENHKLIAPLILRNLPDFKRFVRQEITFEDVGGVNLRLKLMKEMHQDGANLVVGRFISNKVYVHDLVPRVLNRYRLASIEVLQRQFLPRGFGPIGARTLNALCCGLAGGRGYVVKQTAHGSSGMGKVLVFDGTGLHAEFSLQVDRTRSYPSSMYFNPLRKVVGVLSVYGVDKNQVQSKVIAPAQLNINPQKYFDIPERIIASMKGFAGLMV